MKKKQASPERSRSVLDGIGPDRQSESFDDVYVKELWWLQAIQLLKRFNNNLDNFLASVVKYNSRYEKIEFTNLHRHLVEMGELQKLHLKETKHMINQKYAQSDNQYAERTHVINRKRKVIQ